MKKNIFLSFFIGCLASCSLAQNIKDPSKTSVKINTKAFKGIKVQGPDTLPNFQYKVESNDSPNDRITAYFLNSEYIHSPIGIDIKRIAEIGHEKKRKWHLTFDAPRDSILIFEGQAFRSYVFLNCEEYQPHLVTLWDLQKKYVPHILPKDCLFMIDESILTTDLIRYKLDQDYIDSIIIIQPKQIQALDSSKYLNICLFHIFTKRIGPRNSSIFFTGENNIIGENKNKTGKKELFTLQDILNKNIPDNTGTEGGYLFMINEQFILSDLANIKIDPDYIYTVRVYAPTELQRLNGGIHNITLLRIYVKDQETIELCKDKILLGEGSVLKSY